MIEAFEKIGIEENFMTTHQAVSLLWEWRKYRNQVFWNSMYRWGAASLVFTVIPYLLPDLIGKLGIAIFVFPFLAFLLATIGAYLLAVQYILYKQVDRRYRSLLGSYTPEEMPHNKPFYRILRISIGKILSMVFLTFAILVQFMNSMVLLWLLQNKIR